MLDSIYHMTLNCFDLAFFIIFLLCMDVITKRHINAITKYINQWCNTVIKSMALYHSQTRRHLKHEMALYHLHTRRHLIDEIRDITQLPDDFFKAKGYCYRLRPSVLLCYCISSSTTGRNPTKFGV